MNAQELQRELTAVDPAADVVIAANGALVPVTGISSVPDVLKTIPPFFPLAIRRIFALLQGVMPSRTNPHRSMKTWSPSLWTIAT